MGDGKQSIFSFQRAEPAWFATMRDHFANRARQASADWARVPLNVSFRSASCVLAAVDAVFARPEAAAGVVPPDEQPLHHVARRAGMAGLVELWPPVAPGDPAEAEPWELPVEQRRASEPAVRLAQAIAETVRGNGSRGANGSKRAAAGSRRATCWCWCGAGRPSSPRWCAR